MKNLREEIRKTLDACNGKTYESVAIEFQILFRQAIDETIGENNIGGADGRPFLYADLRNQLRAEQRERANKLMPKE